MNLSKPALVIGDTHIPCMKEGYLDFCLEVKKKHKCDDVFSIGDVFELSSLSFHERDPELPSPGDELAIAKKDIKQFIKMFPRLTVMTGNHDSLPARQAKKAGIPEEMLKSPREIFNTPPAWEWWMRKEVYKWGNVLLAHGDIYNPSALKNAVEHGMHYVHGHYHSKAGVYWAANERAVVYGVEVGCGVDRHKRAMMYSKGYKQKPVISCAVIWQDHATVETMPL